MIALLRQHAHVRQHAHAVEWFMFCILNAQSPILAGRELIKAAENTAVT